jgi:hypothetical protein
LVQGYTELTIKPKTPLSVIKLNARQFRMYHVALHALSLSLTELNQTHGTPDVSSVKVNGIESTFEYSNYMEQPVLQSDGSDGGVRNLKAFNVFHKAASDACDEGALQINIPASLEVRSIVLQVLGMR